jgi:hypothetical protein
MTDHSGTMTFLMFMCRYFVFNLQESSKYLLAKGRDEDALAVRQSFPLIPAVAYTLSCPPPDCFIFALGSTVTGSTPCGQKEWEDDHTHA